MADSYKTLEEFWPFYVSQHLHPTTRRLHFWGTTAALALLIASAALRAPLLVLLAVVAGYGFAWVGHFVYEKNKPATFRWAWLSFRADLRMYRLTLTNQMDAEILRLSAQLKALRAG